jgi:Fe-S oxidoreductase
MLRAKAIKARKGETKFRDRLLTSTDLVGRLAGIPVVAELVNAANRSKLGRRLLEKALEVHPEAPVPAYHWRTARGRLRRRLDGRIAPQATAETRGKVVLFTTCYGNRNEPDLATDLAAVFEHNGIAVALAPQERCCGMPKLELGDLEAVARLKEANIPQLKRMVEQGCDIVAPVPSCVLMFKQELPLMFPEDRDVQLVKQHIFDPFEYLMLRHKAGLLRTDFRNRIGKVSYQVPCHLRVQNIGLKTRDLLRLIPDTTVEVIERCSGHDGTYAIKSEFREASLKITRPVAQRVADGGADYYSSDCPMAGHQIASALAEPREPTPPMKLLRMAYGI